ncbi:uracil phosphoribosyltransferase [Truepera radiovictrix]|uniref:Uracil phosphoribosyltransferase n=1 Tax=Truepera radiovictrix (strain DSM 17093 / CIP 108686 / LMG 22925 / RQ-24) TaxID=649638 RepID=D7CTG1_TRURR|nr:uracil phosphoribosyltransferase [Truepera radiovictrix]ADI13818.1 uracil phosphoribosyltransferase [Truepera radiovictrix DSM 17093]WMT57617.1 uracil phosphoribosyltransferase [Truepera radiovictrix]
MPDTAPVTVIDHPLVQHKLAILRDKNTDVRSFRDLCREISMLMAFEAMRHLPLEEVTVETPVAPARVRRLSGKKLALIAILRAGLVMVDGILTLVPAARVGHIGLYRDPQTLAPVQYYNKLPSDVAERDVFLLDPMLATGGSAVAAVSILKGLGAKAIRLLCILGAPEGIAAVHEAHPDVEIILAAQDERLNEHGYIVPGLGDAGDRIYGTR